MESKFPKMHVLIIGAGTTGLLIAQGLQKSNISYTLFERESTTSWTTPKRTWSMMLHWGADYLPVCLPPNLLKRVDEMVCDPFYNGTFEGVKIEDGFPFVNGEKGDVVARVPGGQNPTRLNRQKMRVFCANGIDIQYDKKFVSFDTTNPESVTVHFSDGTSNTGTHLIGADSSRSLIRTSLFRNSPDPSIGDVTSIPIHMFNCVQRYSREQALAMRRNFHPISQIAVHPRYKCAMMISNADVPDLHDPETWLFHVVVMIKYRDFNATMLTTPHFEHSQAENGEKLEVVTDVGDVFEDFKHVASLGRGEKDMVERVRWLRDSFSKHWCEPFRSALAGLKEDTYIPDDAMSYWATPSTWENFEGRVTIAGDAAHPGTPNRGQFLNNAVRDAAEIVLLMQGIQKAGVGSQKELMDNYDEEVLERGTAEIGLSLKSSLGICEWEKLMESPMVKMGLQKVK